MRNKASERRALSTSLVQPALGGSRTAAHDPSGALASSLSIRESSVADNADGNGGIVGVDYTRSIFTVGNDPYDVQVDSAASNRVDQRFEITAGTGN